MFYFDQQVLNSVVLDIEVCQTGTQNVFEPCATHVIQIGLVGRYQLEVFVAKVDSLRRQAVELRLMER